jgi:hypothetical protein
MNVKYKNLTYIEKQYKKTFLLETNKAFFLKSNSTKDFKTTYFLYCYYCECGTLSYVPITYSDTNWPILDNLRFFDVINKDIECKCNKIIELGGKEEVKNLFKNNYYHENGSIITSCDYTISSGCITKTKRKKEKVIFTQMINNIRFKINRHNLEIKIMISNRYNNLIFNKEKKTIYYSINKYFLGRKIFSSIENATYSVEKYLLKMSSCDEKKYKGINKRVQSHFKMKSSSEFFEENDFYNIFFGESTLQNNSFNNSIITYKIHKIIETNPNVNNIKDFFQIYLGLKYSETLDAFISSFLRKKRNPFFLNKIDEKVLLNINNNEKSLKIKEKKHWFIDRGSSTEFLFENNKFINFLKNKYISHYLDVSLILRMSLFFKEKELHYFLHENNLFFLQTINKKDECYFFEFLTFIKGVVGYDTLLIWLKDESINYILFDERIIFYLLIKIKNKKMELRKELNKKKHKDFYSFLINLNSLTSKKVSIKEYLTDLDTEPFTPVFKNKNETENISNFVINRNFKFNDGINNYEIVPIKDTTELYNYINELNPSLTLFTENFSLNRFNEFGCVRIPFFLLKNNELVSIFSINLEFDDMDIPNDDEEMFDKCNALSLIMISENGFDYQYENILSIMFGKPFVLHNEEFDIIYFMCINSDTLPLCDDLY